MDNELPAESPMTLGKTVLVEASLTGEDATLLGVTEAITSADACSVLTLKATLSCVVTTGIVTRAEAFGVVRAAVSCVTVLSRVLGSWTASAIRVLLFCEFTTDEGKVVAALTSSFVVSTTGAIGFVTVSVCVTALTSSFVVSTRGAIGFVTVSVCVTALTSPFIASITGGALFVTVCVSWVTSPTNAWVLPAKAVSAGDERLLVGRVLSRLAGSCFPPVSSVWSAGVSVTRLLGGTGRDAGGSKLADGKLRGSISSTRSRACRRVRRDLKRAGSCQDGIMGSFSSSDVKGKLSHGKKCAIAAERRA
jgi:hypothetical protein